MSKTKRAFGFPLMLAVALLLLLPSFALAAPTGVPDLFVANGEAVTIADPSTDVSNDAFDPDVDTSKPMWQQDAALQGVVNPTADKGALVYWKTGEFGGQPINTYVYLSEKGELLGGGILDATPLDANVSITQTGGKLARIGGGGYNRDLAGNVSIAIKGGQCGTVVGGGVASAEGSDTAEAVVTGSIKIDVSGGEIAWLFGGGVAITNQNATAPAFALVEGNTDVTLSGGARITGGVALSGGVSSSGGQYAAVSSSRPATLTIALPAGAPGQNALGSPTSPILVVGGVIANNPHGGGNAACEITDATIRLQSGTVYGLVAGGSVAMRTGGTGGTDAYMDNAAVIQTGGYVLADAKGQGGSVSGGGVIVLPTSGSHVGIDERVRNASVRVSGGMANSVTANGVVLRPTLTGYADTTFVNIYDNTGDTVITGGSVKGAAGSYTANPAGLYQTTDPSLRHKNPTLANGATPVYRTAILLHQDCGSSLAACKPLKNKPVSALRGVTSYGMKDVYTDNASAPKEAGGVYAWLPAGSKVAGAISGGVSYAYQPNHPGSDAHYSDTTASDDLTWMVLKGATPPVPPTGDGERSLLWLGLILLSAVGGGACLYRNAKRRGQSR